MERWWSGSRSKQRSGMGHGRSGNRSKRRSEMERGRSGGRSKRRSGMRRSEMGHGQNGGREQATFRLTMASGGCCTIMRNTYARQT